jgi:hypothetical protein
MIVTRQALAVWLMIQARVEVMHRTELTFEVLLKRWGVEQTFAWFNHYHRLNKNHEFIGIYRRMLLKVFINFLTSWAALITAILVYLMANKLWKRKHEPAVADKSIY